jgi:riboflavin synthase
VFTGLIQTTGEVIRAERRSDHLLVGVRPDRALDCAIGDSIAVNGVCLTATSVTATSGTATSGTATSGTASGFEVLAGAETLGRTNLGKLRAGLRVNLEPALRTGDRLGGHFVQGHVDGVGAIADRRDRGANLEIDIRAPAALGRYFVDKGSVAVDGISLTINRTAGSIFSVALIPHTVSETTLGDRRVGDEVNLEVDMIAKYVEKLVAGYVVEQHS